MKRTVDEQAKQKRQKRLQQQEAAADQVWWKRYPDSGGEYYFVVGHTSGEAPFGITWEEAREQGLIKEHAPFGSPETEE